VIIYLAVGVRRWVARDERGEVFFDNPPFARWAFGKERKE
jgi:hypothetical protein